jgi:hypothetical protein
VLARNADVIAVMQAGFVGQWGEWHDSSNGLTGANEERAILSAVLAALPPERQTQLRFPRDKQRIFNDQFTPRVGHHDDCFLSNDTDGGTYTPGPIAPWKWLIEADGHSMPTGGEACTVTHPRTDCPTALSELAWMHYSFLDRDFNKDVLATWGDDTHGCMPEIQRRLGYRFRLTEAIYDTKVPQNQALHLTFRLHNDGFASPFNARPVFAVLIGPTGARYPFLIAAADPRQWYAGTDPVVLAADLPLSDPSGVPRVPAGDGYRLALWMPDAAESLRPRWEYSIQLANAGVWDPSTGMNTLASAIRITPPAP